MPREKRLAFTVVPAMPRLEVSLEGLPATLPAGAAALATLRVRNVASGGPDGGSGTGPAAHRVRVRLPSGGVALPADVAAAGEIGDASEAKSASEGKSPSDAKSASASDPSKRGSPNVSQTSPSSGGPIGTTYEPPAWSRLPAGAEATMALWIHPTETGAVDVPVVVCYEPPPPAPPLLKYRTVRCAAGTIATPSMVVSATVANAATHPAARVVRVSAANATSGSEAPKSSYEIRSVALVREGDGPRATLTTMGAPASTPRIVAPGRRWDTLLLAAPATEVEDAAFDADSANFVSAKIRIGAAAESEPTPGSRPPVVRLHRASAPERFGGRGAADSGTSRANATNANGRADVLDGVDVVVEWSEIPPVGSDRVGAIGAHHIRAVADPVAKNGPDGRNRRPLHSASALRDVRWTLEGPSTATLPGSGKANATDEAPVVVPVTLRAHNPTPAAVRITFEAQTISAESDEDGWTAKAGGAGRSGAGWSDAGAVAAADETVADDGASRVPARVSPGRPWLWVGPVKRSVVARGGETVDVPLRVAAFVPGTFALGQYRVSWELADAGVARGGGKHVAAPSRACNAPFLITVVEPQRAER